MAVRSGYYVTLMKARVPLDRIRFFFLDAALTPAAGQRRLAHQPAIDPDRRKRPSVICETSAR